MKPTAAFLAYMSGRITADEMHRYLELHSRLMGNDSLVEIDESHEWKEFNELTKKIMK